MSIAKKITTFTLILLLALNAKAQITVHTIGDSTMEQKSEDPVANPNGQRGWAQMLNQFLVNGALLNNRSKSGTSSKTFYEGKDSNGNYRFWFPVKPQIKAGDYVFIQFGHNDEKDGGWQSSQNGATYSGIGTNPWEQYTLYLTRFVNEVRALGATPVLLTPIVRNGFSGAVMTNTACHNIGTDSVGRPLDYPAAARKVAADMNCALVDHTLLTKAACEQYGQTKVTQLIYNVGDGTHLGEYGATLYARLAVQDLIRQGILTNYLNANPDLLISVKNYDFGKCYANTINTYQLSISGVDLSPSEGNISITAPEGFLVSTQLAGSYTATLQIPYTNNNLGNTSVYIKYQPTTTGISQGNLLFSYGSGSKSIGLKGECVSFEGGQNTSVHWELSANSTAIVNGPISVIDEKYSKMTLQSYAAPNATTTWTGGLIANGTKTQRNVIEGSAWPAGEIDIVNDRFIQFGVTAVKGTTFNIDSIGLYAGGAGGSGMRFKIYISTDSLFSDNVTMIADRQSNAGNTMYPVSYTKLIELKSEKSLYFRVFPWYNGAATGKTICLYGLHIKGVVTTDPTGIIQPETNDVHANCLPTVTKGKSTLSFQLKKQSDIHISLNAIDGRVLYQKNISNLPVGSYNEVLSLTNYSSGIYYCKVKNGNTIQTMKIIKQ